MKSVISCFLIGLLCGGIVKLFTPATSFAQNVQHKISVQELQLVNAFGKMTGRWMGKADWGQGISLYDEQGNSRLEAGLFPDGRPSIALNDERHVPKELLKLEWAQNIPMFFMKEPRDQNRLIMALDLKNSDVPFLVLFDGQGQKKEIFGKFEMPK